MISLVNYDTYLVVLVNVLVVFLVYELDDCDGLALLCHFVFRDHTFLHSNAIKNHLGSMAIDRYNHDVTNVFLVCPVVDGGLVVR